MRIRGRGERNDMTWRRRWRRGLDTWIHQGATEVQREDDGWLRGGGVRRSERPTRDP